MAKKKQLPAGKSKAVTAAAKRKAAKLKDSGRTTTRIPTTKKGVGTAKLKKGATPAVATPTSPVSAQAPVSSPTGSLISPETWAQDQARLQSAAEDQDTADSLNEAEADADATYTQRTTDAAKAAALRKIELQKQKDQFEKEKSTDYKNLNTNMSYRGASRSSAALRGTDEVGAQHGKIADAYREADLGVTTELSDINTKAYNEREATKTYVSKRRGTLANRAASRGVYSEGAGEEDGGVTAPGINPAASASGKPKKVKTAPTYRGKYRGPDRFKGDMKKVAANRAAAAKRRVKGKH